MDLKALKEQEATAKKEMRSLLDKIKGEKRAVHPDEATKLEDFKKTISETRGAINFATTELEKAKKQQLGVEKRNMTEIKKGKVLDVEKRAMASILRNVNPEQDKQYRDFIDFASQNEEYRALSDDAGLLYGNANDNTVANGGVTVPLNVASDIILKLRESAPVFNMVRKIGGVSGTLRLPRESVLGDDAGWVGELQDATTLKPQLTYVQLTQKRVAAALQLSQDVINMSAVGLVDYSTQYLTRKLGNALEKAILVSPATNPELSFSSITGDSHVTQGVAMADPENPTVEEMISMINSLISSYRAGAAFVVSQSVFKALSLLKDGDNTYLRFKATLPATTQNATPIAPGNEFLGYPVYVSPYLDGTDHPIVFGNFGVGYTVINRSALTVSHVTNDTTQAMAGGHLIVLAGYMDGAVTNPDAFALASKKA